jgi:hypothetical protein
MVTKVMTSTVLSAFNSGLNLNRHSMIHKGPYTASIEKYNLQRDISCYRSLLNHLKPHFEELHNVTYDFSEHKVSNLEELKTSLNGYMNTVNVYALKLQQSDFVEFLKKIPSIKATQTFKEELIQKNHFTAGYWSTKIDQLGGVFQQVNTAHSSMLKNIGLAQALLMDSQPAVKNLFFENCEHLTGKLDHLKNRISAFCASEAQANAVLPPIPWEKTLKEANPALAENFIAKLETEVSSISHELQVLDSNCESVSYLYWELRVKDFKKQIDECAKKMGNSSDKEDGKELSELKTVYKKACSELAAITEKNKGLSKELKTEMREAQTTLDKLKKRLS